MCIYIFSSIPFGHLKMHKKSLKLCNFQNHSLDWIHSNEVGKFIFFLKFTSNHVGFILQYQFSYEEFSIYYDQSFYNNLNKIYLSLFFSKISFKFSLNFFSISNKYDKSYFINCITKFNLNPVYKVVCNYIVVIVRWICYKYLESVGEYIVNVNASNLGIKKFVFCFIFCILKWAWL